MTASSPRVPLYHQVLAVLRQRILDGTYPAGHRLSKEDDLAKEFGVSRATVRQAVGGLVVSGLLSRKQGSGTYVLDARPTMHRFVFRADMQDLLSASADPIHVARDVRVKHGQELPPDIAAHLEIPGQRGTVVTRTMLEGGSPLAHHRNYLPSALGKAVTARKLARQGVMVILEDTGMRFGSATQSIRAVAASPDLAETLEIPAGSPLLMAQRLLLDIEERPVELVRTWYAGERYEYFVEFSG